MVAVDGWEVCHDVISVGCSGLFSQKRRSSQKKKGARVKKAKLKSYFLTTFECEQVSLYYLPPPLGKPIFKVTCYLKIPSLGFVK
jgi:hypothetical protein